MTEETAISAVEEPLTVDSLVEAFRGLGVERGETYLVHSSLSRLGWVCVDAQAVVDALMAAVTEAGTIVVPTHSSQYTDPAAWSNPPVPDEWIETIRTSRPPYRPKTTPTRGMGAIAECFRTYPDVRRSRHPTMSFAAWGRDADRIVEDHELDDGLGEGSPLARVYDLDGQVLLLGVGHDVNTSLHLAEYRADIALERTTNVVPVLEDGERVLAQYSDLDIDDGDFGELGAAFEATHEVTTGSVGAATARLFSQRAIVDFGVDWLEANR